MLRDVEIEQLLVELGIPDAGRKLVRDARVNSPVRDANSNLGNSIVWQYSAKMGNRHLELESRTVEAVAGCDVSRPAENRSICSCETSPTALSKTSRSCVSIWRNCLGCSHSSNTSRPSSARRVTTPSNTTIAISKVSPPLVVLLARILHVPISVARTTVVPPAQRPRPPTNISTFATVCYCFIRP